MPYATSQDIAELHGTQFLNDLADRDQSGTVDTNVVDSAIISADAEINTYLAMRYTTPLAMPTPEIVKIASVEIASYRLASNGLTLTEDIRKRYEDMIALLKLIASGKAGLGIPADQIDVPADDTFQTPVAYVGRNMR